MNWYAKTCFPRLLEKVMSKQELKNKRREVLKHARGTILEIGFGTGLNLTEYPLTVHEITTIDVNAGMKVLAKQHMKSSPITVHYYIGSVEALPFDDRCFDTIVSTWTLCSVDDIHKSLQEIKRVLKPDGQLLFIEHGLSHNKNIAKWQQWISPLWQRVSLGCHLNRNMKKLLQENGFHLNVYTEFIMPKTHRLIEQTYQGIATSRRITNILVTRDPSTPCGRSG